MRLRHTLLLLMLSVATRAVAAEEPQTPTVPQSPAADAVSVAAAKSAPATGDDPETLDTLFLRWDDPATGERLEKALNAGLAARPDDFGLVWRKARLRWSQADRLQGEARKKLAKEAWALGEKAIQLQPKRVEGHYWAGVGVGAYSQALGIISALTQGLEGRFTGFIDRAIEIDPDYFGGAPMAAKGRYHFELPWPKRNLNRAVELLTRVNTQHPDNLRAWLFRAEAELARGKPELAQEALEQVQKRPGSRDPADARYSKKLARAFAPEVQKKLKR